MNTKENGTLFNIDDPCTYPPAELFVITNYLDQPAVFDRDTSTWWTPIFDEVGVYGREDIVPDKDDPLYWQIIEFRKTDVLLMPASQSAELPEPTDR
ncbi:hypothetical protein [Marinobacterium jannaschii]|uniref:hypothetical protein n=1 Tax=Marinobacterium jannaschii TaxID=64970 RepID=UPI000484A333|nr:hypothetical protein [Marinobacterium jannaschii]